VAEDRAAAELWPALAAAVQPGPRPTAAIVRRSPSTATIRATRVAARIAGDVAAATEPVRLSGVALEHARETAASALGTIERLADDGWRAVIGDGPADAADIRLGADAVAERSDPFDPLGRELGRVQLAR
jgi:hypothetical protein